MDVVLRTGTSPRRYLAKNCANAPASCPLLPSGAFVDAASTF